MAYVKYTREMLSEAVAASTSMAAVLRHLGLRQTGGAHAHLRRRIAKLDIDTSHFLGSAHYRGTHSLNRRRADQILILRPSTASREKPQVLRRALEELGRPIRCAECNLEKQLAWAPACPARRSHRRPVVGLSPGEPPFPVSELSQPDGDLRRPQEQADFGRTGPGGR